MRNRTCDDEQAQNELANAYEEIERMHNIIAIQQKQIERLLEARDIEKARADRMDKGYSIKSDGVTTTITCHKCGRTSGNTGDVRERYCGFCHVFHEEEKGQT